jgi:hypothetical protein
MDATLYWIDAERGGDSRLSWSDIRRWHRYEDDIPVLGHSLLSYGDYDNSGSEERSNYRRIREDFPDTADSDSVFWDVYGGHGSAALVLRLPPQTARWMEFVAGRKIHANPALSQRFPFGFSEVENERWGEHIQDALIARMWSRCHHNLPSDQWDNAADVLETLQSHLAYDEDDQHVLEEEMYSEAWTDWAWDDFQRDLKREPPLHWSENLCECLDTVLESVTDAGGVLAWLTADGDLDHGIEGGGNVYFRWDSRLTEVWEHFEDHGTLPWDAADKPDTTDPAQLTLEVESNGS